MKLYLISCLLLLTLSVSTAQTVRVDTIYSFKDAIINGKIRTGTDTLISYIESEALRDKISENIRVIEFEDNQYKVTTYNIPVGSADITKVVALLDNKDLHIKEFYLKANKDSAFAEYNGIKINGWLQLPEQEKRIINYTHSGNTFLSDGNTPWLPGLLNLKENIIIVIPVFHLFSNSLQWRSYKITGTEEISINNKFAICWKVDAGPLGPPGFNAYHWYEQKTGRLLQVELSKEGEPAKYISELKNIH